MKIEMKMSLDKISTDTYNLGRNATTAECNMTPWYDIHASRLHRMHVICLSALRQNAFW
jgi:hypothetical protein